MRFFFVAFAGAMLFAGHAAQANVAITVDKNTQMMTVAVDGVERYHWPVSTGIPSRETPSGSFRTFRMEEDHYSKEFDDAPMPHAIFFTKIGHAIHGTDSVNRLGMPASHGCVRLSRDNATTLYALVEQEGVLKTTVTLTGSAQVALARGPRRAPAAVAGRNLPRPDEQQYSAAGEPVDITAPPVAQIAAPPVVQGRGIAPQVRADDGYIYPADGSPDVARYPSPRRRLYDAQAYPQQPQYQDYSNQGYAQPASPPSYYQQHRTYQPRGFY